MKKIIAGAVLAMFLLAPTASFAQTTTQSDLQVRYQAALAELIKLLTTRLHELQAQLAVQQGRESAEDDGRDRDEDRNDRDRAEDAIDEAEEDLDDAHDEVKEADENGVDTDDAENLLEDAERELDRARDAYDDRDYDDAIDRAEEAQDLIDEALDELESRDADAEDDDRDEDEGEGEISVSTIPLLTGGTIRAGDEKPVAYLQVRNTGDTEVEIEGFWLTQNGSADASAVRSLSTVDDKGGSRATSDDSPFDDEVGFAPSGAVIAPGAMKLFTVKMELDSAASVSGTYKLDVTDIETDADVRASFPLRGTTWTVGS